MAELTQPWATVIQGVCALLAVLLAWLLLAGKVKDLRAALDKSREAIDNHAITVENRLAEIERRFAVFDDRLTGVDEQVASSIESVNVVRGTVQDIEARQEELSGEDGPPSSTLPGRQRDRGELAKLWGDIRDRIETIAADPEIDGRTRAAFGRIDRRSYYALIEALDSKSLLHGKAADFTEAAELWYANRRRFSGYKAVEKMADLHDRLLRG